MTSNDVQTIASLVAAFASCASAVFFFRSINIARQSLARAGAAPVFAKAIDIINDCNKRYDTLKDIHYPLNPTGVTVEARAELYFRKYWSLQSDQLDYYLMGLVDLITYGFWIERMVDMFGREQIFTGWTARDGWERFGQRSFAQNRPFQHLVTQIRAYASTGLAHNGTAITSEEFARRLAVGLYNDRSIRDYRNALRNAALDNDTLDWSDVSKKMVTAYQPVAAVFDPDQFSAAVDHEKRIILGPAIVRLFNQISFLVNEQAHVLDYGCGPFLIGRHLQDAGFLVDGYDYHPEMIRAAQKSFPQVSGQIMTSDLKRLRSQGYPIVLMSFVHQIAPDRGSLRRDFLAPAAGKVGSNGRLIIVGAYPEHMGTEFSAMKCVPTSREDGAAVEGRLFSDDAGSTYAPSSDHYWQIATVRAEIADLGFDEELMQSIPDVASNLRPAGPTGKPPYFILVMRRKN